MMNMLALLASGKRIAFIVETTEVGSTIGNDTDYGDTKTFEKTSETISCGFLDRQNLTSLAFPEHKSATTWVLAKLSD